MADVQALALASLWLSAAPLRAQPPRGAVDEAVSAMGLSAGAPVSVARSRLTGYATFLASAPGHPVPVLDAAASTAEKRARAGPGWSLRCLYCAVAQAWLLGVLSVSTPASNRPLPLQSFHAVAT